MLLGTLTSSILENVLVDTGKGVLRAGEGMKTTSQGRGVTTAGEGRNRFD